MARRVSTVEDVKTYSNVSQGYALSDDKIERFIEQATSKIMSFTRRNWLYGKYVDFVDLAGLNWTLQPERRFQKVFTNERPLRSTPFPVITYTLTGNFSDGTRLPANDFTVDEHAGAITLLLAYAPQMPRALRIEYYAGFEPDPEQPEILQVSNDLREACAMQAAFLYSRAQNETLGLKRQQDKSGIKDFNILGSGFIREVQGLLTPHVRSLTGG